VGILVLLGLGVAALIELLAHQAAGYTPVFGRYTWKYLLMMAGYLLGLATLSARLIWLSISKRELRPVSAQVTIVFLIVYAAACAGVWVLLPRFAASVILSSNLLLRPALTLMLSLGLLSLPQADARLWRQVVGVSAGLGMLGARVGFGALY